MINGISAMHAIAPGYRLPDLSVEITTSLVVVGAVASRDWQPQHHDRTFAQERNGMRDIFVNTPHNAALLERYVTDWSGPMGRIGKLKFRMLAPVYPGDTVVFSATVTAVHDAAGCRWVDIQVVTRVAGEERLTGTVRLALPGVDGANPWRLTGEAWAPDFAPGPQP